ncbi:SDR family NAD(P)-dependent oxidoreductase [Aliirhizobium smilacinae]|uniref:SDR family NAD(P)-dependent oxidoreductase n=1 Tax=Aliirhizobium smilacinae TaxID=1395944 RepID=A0A5C4XPZ4_9HYPH|nr:SDR family NAD(P)-dependent oxidoreductase [Rhizobium smilacinae]TNM65378.1 SDR family NAD(P)-dependent oxidoreductase [Rhizobium smilacinae]
MHVVVTGGSSGIGLEVAKIYACRGASVSLIARNVDRLQAARNEIERTVEGGGKIFVIGADAASGVELSAAIQACEATFGPCDILVASAGIVEPGWFHEQAVDIFQVQWQTNVTGVVNAVRAVYAGMRRRGQGRIMIVSSAAAFIGIPAYTAYCASKSALVGFADALRLEAVGTDISVGICFPPDTDTPQLSREIESRPREAALLMGTIKPSSAADIGRKLVVGVDRRRGRVYFTSSVAALAMLGPVARPIIAWWYKHRISH